MAHLTWIAKKQIINIRYIHIYLMSQKVFDQYILRINLYAIKRI